LKFSLEAKGLYLKWQPVFMVYTSSIDLNMLPLMNMVLLTTPKTCLLRFDGFKIYQI
jgi:hypothetical protein